MCRHGDTPPADQGEGMLWAENVMGRETNKKDMESARDVLKQFAKLERKNCLAYEFVALKLGVSKDKASRICIELHMEKS